MTDIELDLTLSPAVTLDLALGSPIEMPLTLAPDVFIDLELVAKGETGADGAPGEGVPTGGTTGQVLAKTSATDYDTEWVDQSGGGGAVDSVNAQTGTVVLDADDIDDTSTTHKFVAAADLTKLSNLSGTNTGDQDLSSYATTASLSSYVPTTRTVNGAALSSNVTLNQDNIGDGTTYKQYSATEKMKLAGIATGATVNSSDATLLSRANHTGTQTASTISDFSTAADARITAAVGTTVQAYDADLTTWGGKTAPSGTVVGTTDTQTLTGKTISGSNNTLSDIAQSSVTNLTTDLAGKASTSHTHAVNDLSDVTITTPSTGQVLKYNGSAWINDTDATASGGSGVTDHGDLTGLSDDDHTQYALADGSRGSFAATSHTHVATTDLTATGTKSSATYLRGDNTWNTPTNTTYSEISEAEITAGTASTSRTISGRRSEFIVNKARNRANHTGTQDHTTISDYDTELAGTANTTAFTPTADYHPATKKYVDDEITAAGGYNDEAAQDAIGTILTDSSEIDFTYNDATPSITASLVAGSIDETKLDTSVNASLDLADSAIQSGDLATVATTGAYSDLSVPDGSIGIGKLTEQISPGFVGSTNTGPGGTPMNYMSASDARSILNVEDGADVTDATNVAAAGAYMSGGTDVALADGGTGASLTDPNADRIMFWDDSAGAVTWLTPSTGLTVSGTNMTVRTSSATQTGIVELATTTETTTATDTARAVTPAGIGAERSSTATLTNKTLSTGSTIDANVTVTEVLKKVYPVGSIYINRTSSTNPATLLGFGTWTAIQDKMIMGRGSTYTADGGSATHTHTLSSTGYAKIGQGGSVVTNSNITVDSYSTNNRMTGTVASPSATTSATELGGSTDSGSTIPPMIVAYIWERVL